MMASFVNGSEVKRLIKFKQGHSESYVHVRSLLVAAKSKLFFYDFA